METKNKIQETKEEIIRTLKGKKITRCPKCKKIIDYLCVDETITGGLTYSEEGFDEYPNEREADLIFICPDCDAVIFNNEEEAQDFFGEE